MNILRNISLDKWRILQWFGLWIGWLLAPVLMASFVPDATVITRDVEQAGSCEIYYTAFPSTSILPNIASQYNLERGPRHGIVNISVRDLSSSQIGEPVSASLVGQTTNLLGQRSALTFKKISETGAIYYLASFRYSNEELIKFKVTVTPDNQCDKTDVQFSRTFYEESP